MTLDTAWLDWRPDRTQAVADTEHCIRRRRLAHHRVHTHLRTDRLSGGELPAAQTYLVEHTPRERRGFFASSIYVSGTLGILVGLLLGVGLGLGTEPAQT